MPVIMIRER